MKKEKEGFKEQAGRSSKGKAPNMVGRKFETKPVSRRKMAEGQLPKIR